jgi:large conductance mechanosensitive channel
MWKEFKEFAFKGNVIDMAVGVMIGAAFGKIISSLVNDLFMPVISLLTGNIEFNNLFIAMDGNSYATLEAAQEAGVATFNYGTFIMTIIDFILIALCIFLFVKMINKLKRKKAEPEPETPKRLCPYCCTEIPEEATRCPHCTSILTEEAEA